MIGYPRGLPAKVSSGKGMDKKGTVIGVNRSSGYFTVRLDCMHGYSGSPVFSRETGKIVGVFSRVRPKEDFEEN